MQRIYNVLRAVQTNLLIYFFAQENRYSYASFLAFLLLFFTSNHAYYKILNFILFRLHYFSLVIVKLMLYSCVIMQLLTISKVRCICVDCKLCGYLPAACKYKQIKYTRVERRVLQFFSYYLKVLLVTTTNNNTISL